MPFRRTAAAVPLVALVLLLAAAVRPAAAIETVAREAILMDMETGAVLFEKNAHEPMPPASMSKLMTLYMVFERLKEGSLSLDDKFPVSENAWKRGGAKSGSSTMFLLPNSQVRVEDLLHGIIVQSGNDACIVVAEALAGSEAAFAEQMTRKAAELGLENSHFINATGWPDPDHRMTAYDLAILAKKTIENFPEYYEFYAETEFTYNDIRQMNRNPLLYKGMGVDGLKTGHTENAGYGLTASAERDGRRLILVVNGLESKQQRSDEPQRLLEWGFREFRNYALFTTGETVENVPVWLGQQPTVPAVIGDDVKLTLARKHRDEMKATVVYDSPVPAPITQGQQVATVRLTAPGMETRELPLYAAQDIERLGFFGRITAALEFLIWGG
jgi:serine-type D-Ala-D-Ala carboxypeptidase (penicillin-binding protein 5/6)